MSVMAWTTQGDAFGHRVAAWLREEAETARAARGGTRGRALIDLAEYTHGLGISSQPLATLQALNAASTGTTGEYRPGKYQRRLVSQAASLGQGGVMGGLPTAEDFLDELLLAAALDARDHVGHAVADFRAELDTSTAALQKADRRILQLEGVEGANVRLRGENIEQGLTIDKLEQQLAHLRAQLEPAEEVVA